MRSKGLHPHAATKSSLLEIKLRCPCMQSVDNHEGFAVIWRLKEGYSLSNPPTLCTAYTTMRVCLLCSGLESPGGLLPSSPAQAYDMYPLPPSPMTPAPHARPQQQQQQPMSHVPSPYQIRGNHVNNPGAPNNLAVLLYPVSVSAQRKGLQSLAFQPFVVLKNKSSAQ